MDPKIGLAKPESPNAGSAKSAAAPRATSTPSSPLNNTSRALKGLLKTWTSFRPEESRIGKRFLAAARNVRARSKSEPGRVGRRRSAPTPVPQTPPVVAAPFVKKMVIGVGTTTAYYLDAVATGNEAVQWDDYAIVGTTDAWATRGDGYINHQWHNSAHYSQIEEHEYSADYMSRKEWVAANAAVIDHATKERVVDGAVIDKGAARIEATVSKIEKVGSRFRVTMTGPDGDEMVRIVEELMVCAGAGPHYAFGGPRGPMQVGTGGRAALREKILTLDEFMIQEAAENAEEVAGIPDYREQKRPRKTVLVHGTNAGIDALVRCAQLGYDVKMIGSAAPNFLPGTAIPKWLQDHANDSLLQTTSGQRPFVALEQSPGADPKVVVRFEDAQGRSVEERADCYVMALGQDPMAPGAVGDILRQGGLGADAFEPIYDTNQRFCDRPWETVLGFQSRDADAESGIKILGAAVDSLARAGTRAQPAFPVQHNYLERFKASMTAEHRQEAQAFLAPQGGKPPTMAQLHSRVVRAVPDGGLGSVGSVASPAQLGGVRAVIPAVLGVSAHGQKIHTSVDDRTQVAVRLAADNPQLSDAELDVVLDKTMSTIRDIRSKTAIGLTPEDDERVRQAVRSAEKEQTAAKDRKTPDPEATLTSSALRRE